MSEPQYQSYFDYKHEKLGIMASQYWRDDPKLLGIHLARYKFVSKMLAGKNFVAEIGCGDAWFSKVVGREVSELHVYDFDAGFINDISSRNEFMGRAHVHNILLSSVSEGEFDAAYSLDCMEHIDPEWSGFYLKNIALSLKPNGTFIVGMPSLQSQKYASEASKTGHVNCMNGDDLKKQLEKYFHNVFLFSMNDETVHTGFYPMAHYLIGVCCGVR